MACRCDGNGGSPFGYTGEQTDDTGLVFLRARYYDSATGRFTQRDLWNGNQQLPFTLHVYVYALANPVNLSDPSGQSPSCGGPRCFIIYLTGVGNKINEQGQPPSLDRLEQKLGAKVIRDINPYQFPGNVNNNIEVWLAAHFTSAGKIRLAQDIDRRLDAEKVGPQDEVNIIGWSGGAQMAVGSASQMQKHISNAVLLGGVFMADEGLANIGSVYDLFGENDNMRSVNIPIPFADTRPTRVG